jgi:hypothetical protein
MKKKQDPCHSWFPIQRSSEKRSLLLMEEGARKTNPSSQGKEDID